MRAAITLTLALAAAPASAQICVGGPAESGSLTAGVIGAEEGEDRRGMFGLDVSKFTQDGPFGVLRYVQGDNVRGSRAWRGRAKVGYAAGSAVQLCPLLGVQLGRDIRDESLFGPLASVAVGALVNPGAGLFAQVGLAPTWAAGIALYSEGWHIALGGSHFMGDPGAFLRLNIAIP